MMQPSKSHARKPQKSRRSRRPESTIPQSGFQQSDQIFHLIEDGGLLLWSIQSDLRVNLPQRRSACSAMAIPQ